MVSSTAIFCPELLILPRSILNDREAFNNPEEFQPERYLKDGKLNPDVRDPDCAAFGFGRRSVNTTYPPNIYAHQLLPSICPGRHLSDNSLYSIVSCVLAVYDIKPPVDDQGNILKLKPEFTSKSLTLDSLNLRVMMMIAAMIASLWLCLLVYKPCIYKDHVTTR